MMLVTRGQGNNALLPSAGMGAKGSGPVQIVRNQWVRQWAIEQILANQAAADKRELEEKLRETRKQIRQAPLEVVEVDELPAFGQEPEPAKRQRRRRPRGPATRAPRHGQSAASRQAVAGLFAQQAALKAQLARIDDQIRAAYREALDVLNLEPLRPRSPVQQAWVREQMAKNERQYRDMFTARVTDRRRWRKQEEDALAILLVLSAA